MTRAGRVADDVASDWLDDLITRCTHIGLCSADPLAVMDPLTVEPVNGVYHRSAVEWTKVARLLRNTGSLVWPGIPIGFVCTWYAGWDAYSNGNVVFSAPSPVLSFPNGGGFEIDPLDFFFGLDV